MKIAPYIHRCTIRTGPLEGNKSATEVTPVEFEFEMTCEHCGELLAPGHKMVAHLYAELLQGED